MAEEMRNNEEEWRQNNMIAAYLNACTAKRSNSTATRFRIVVFTFSSFAELFIDTEKQQQDNNTQKVDD